jgi:signal transduction histidine kinase
MLANIAHQWRQPLTELNLAMFSVKKAMLNDDKEGVAKFYDESKRVVQDMSNTIEDFTNFFKPDKKKRSFNIKNSVDDSISILDRVVKQEMINVKTDVQDIEVLGISNEFTQVIVNLIKNSIDAFAHNGILIRELSITTKRDNKFVWVEVGDNAGGITQKDVYKIFEPYFTTKHASQGTGLGLFMSKMICEQGFNGSLDVKSSKNTTAFTIKLPLEEK